VRNNLLFYLLIYFTATTVIGGWRGTCRAVRRVTFQATT